MKETEETFTFYSSQPKESGFYLIKLKKKSKHKLYRYYDIDFFKPERGWRRWDKDDIEAWAEITEKEKKE